MLLFTQLIKLDRSNKRADAVYKCEVFRIILGNMLVHGGELLVPAYLNFGEFVLERLRKGGLEGARLRICSTGEEMSARELSQRAVSVATALTRRGVARGDTVALAGEACAAYVSTALAVVLAGAAFTPIELECGSAILTYKFNLSKPKYVICTRLFWEAYSDTLKSLDFIKTFICYDGVEGMESVEAMVSRDVDVDSFEPAGASGDAVAMIGYSSGTTGMSKGVLLTHLSLISRFQLCSYTFDTQSVNVAAIVYDHTTSYGITSILSLLSFSKTVIFGGNSSIMSIKDFQVELIMSVPKLIYDLITEEQGKTFKSLKALYTTAAALPSEFETIFRERYPEVKIVNVYGASECITITTTKNLVTEGRDQERATIGMAAPGCEVKIVDVDTRVPLGPEQRGEICVRSPAMMKGYLGAPSPVDEQGFYPTGDLGYYDEQKRFYLVDRVSDMINHIGYKVSPRDLESVLLQHPAVEEAAVVGWPSELKVDQELPTAFVVLRRGTVATATELQQYVDDQVTWYMRLRGGVRFLPELPRSPRRKILRQRLRELLNTE